MTTISKAFVGAVAAGAMAMVPLTAASAEHRYERHSGISAGDIIAGAVVLGGIAAVAGTLGRGGYDNRYDNRYYRDGRYDYYNGDPRSAVERCVNAARQDARSRGYRFAEVTQVRDVKDTDYGWKIRGNLVVEGDRYATRYDDRYGSYRNYGDRYGAYRNYGDRYGNYGSYDNRYGGGYGQDSGGFTCWIDRGRVSRMDYSGIRGL